MAEKFKRRKRNYLINKDLQGKMVLKYLLLTVCGSILLGLFFAAASSDHITIRYDDSRVEVGNTPSILFSEILQSGALFLLIGGVLIILITIVLTHKIAGPLYRFEQTLTAMCERKYDHQIYLRKGDEGKELGSLINNCNLLLSNDIRTLKALASKLEDGDAKQQILDFLECYQLADETIQPD